ncbi:MAG: hypothetical protein JWR05_2504 [Mucilaginibacter sp.]|nr:hypothetical protein [Mucilaginibacter sp.]
MKKLLLTILYYFIVTQLFAQSTEFSFGVHGGFMHFSGRSATSSTSITQDQINYTTNPYGSKMGPGFGVYIQGQYFIKSQFFAGLQIGADALKSKVTVTEVNTLANPFPRQANGNSNISSHYLNANPYIGVRFPLSNINLDLIAGLESAYVIDAYDEGLAKYYNGTTEIRTNHDIKTIKIDNRIKLGVAIHYNRLGITANYAQGLSNYISSSGVGGNVNTAILRVGLNLIVF